MKKIKKGFVDWILLAFISFVMGLGAAAVAGSGFIDCAIKGTCINQVIISSQQARYFA